MGFYDSQVIVNAGTLNGDGLVGGIIALGGVVDPGVPGGTFPSVFTSVGNVTLDAAAYARAEAEARAALTGARAVIDPEAAEAAAKRARALRHALAEYELAAFTIVPERELGEVLAR